MQSVGIEYVEALTYGQLLVPETMCTSAVNCVACIVSLKHFSAQQLNFMQHPASFVSENLFSVPTSDL